METRKSVREDVVSTGCEFPVEVVAGEGVPHAHVLTSLFGRLLPIRLERHMVRDNGELAADEVVTELDDTLQHCQQLLVSRRVVPLSRGKLRGVVTERNGRLVCGPLPKPTSASKHGGVGEEEDSLETCIYLVPIEWLQR